MSESPAKPTPTRFLGRYDLLHELGAGGMGVVYLAYDTELHRQVALKMMRGRSRMYQERFRREYRALAAIKHKGVPAIYYSGRPASGDSYFTMEIVSGKTLRSYLEVGRPLAPARALVLAINLGRVLMAVHAAGVVHRDVKPNNIIIEPGDAVRLLDFGACFLTSDYYKQPHLRDVTAKGERWETGECEFIGTPGYTDPECFTLGTTTPQSDIFSICVILYELATGRRLYDEAAGKFRPITPEEFPPELAGLVPELQRGTANAAFERHASMAELVQRLEIVQAHVAPRPRARWLPALALVAAGWAGARLVDLVAATPATSPAAVAVVATDPAPVPPAPSPAPTAVAAPATPLEPAAPPAEPTTASHPPAELDPARPTSLAPAGPTPAGPTPNSRRARPPALSEGAIADILSSAAPALRACPDTPRGWAVLTVRVNGGRATLQELALAEPNSCARKAVAALRFPAGAGEFRVSLQL